MRKNLAEIVFILDRSGSMSGLERDSIGGAIHHIGNVHKYARPEDVPKAVAAHLYRLTEKDEQALPGTLSCGCCDGC